MDKADINKYLKKSFFTGTLKTLVVAITTLGLLPLVIKTVGMNRYGLVSITMLFGGGVVLVDLGISKAVTLLLGKNRDQMENNKLVADAFLLTFGMLLFSGIIVAAIILLNIPVLGSLNVDPKLYTYIIFIGFMSLVVMMINNLFVAVLEGYLLMHYVNIGFGLSSVILHVLLLIVGVLKMSDYVLVAVPLISFTCITIYYLSVIAKKTMLRVTLPRFSRSKQIIPVSFKFLSISLVSTIVNPLNKYILIFLTGNTTIIGIYDVSLKIAFMANSLLNNLAQPLFGMFSKMAEKSTLIFSTAKRVSFLIFVLYCMGLISYLVIGKYLTEYINFENSVLLFSTSLVLLAGIGFNAVSEPFYRALIGLSYLRKAMYYKSSLVLFNLLLFMVFFNMESLNRIAWAYSVAIILSSLIIVFGVINLSKKINSK